MFVSAKNKYNVLSYFSPLFTKKEALLFLHLKNIPGDFPGGLGAKKALSNAGDMDSVLGQGTKNPQVMGQLGLRATSGEPTHHSKDLVQPK